MVTLLVLCVGQRTAIIELKNARFIIIIIIIVVVVVVVSVAAGILIESSSTRMC